MFSSRPIKTQEDLFSKTSSDTAGYRPRQVAACRPKCTVSKQTAHLAALMLSPTVKRWGMLWCILSFTRRPNSAVQRGRKWQAGTGVTEGETWCHDTLNKARSLQKSLVLLFPPNRMWQNNEWTFITAGIRHMNFEVLIVNYYNFAHASEHGMH